MGIRRTIDTAPPVMVRTVNGPVRSRWAAHVPGFPLLYGIILLWAVFLVVETGAATTAGTDYFYYLAVTKLAALGHGAQIYNLGVLGGLERSLAYPLRIPHGALPNVYPPFFALTLMPLAVLPYSAGYLTWLAVNSACLAWALWRLEALLGLTGRARVALRVAATAFLPVVVALLQGQVSMVLLAAFTGCFLALRTGHDRRAGALLGLTLIKPQFALPFLLLLLIHRRRRALLSFAATAAGLSLLPVPFLGLQPLVAYARTLIQATSWGANMGGFQPPVNRSFAGFTGVLLPHGPATAIALLLDLAALAVLVWVAWRTPELEIPFALAVVVSLLASQHVLIHDLSLLILAAAGAWRVRATGPRHLGMVLVAAYLAVVIGFPLAQVLRIQVPTLGMITVGAWLVIAARRARATRVSGV